MNSAASGTRALNAEWGKMNNRECIEVLEGIRFIFTTGGLRDSAIVQAIKWGEEVESLRTQLAERDKIIEILRKDLADNKGMWLEIKGDSPKEGNGKD